MSNVITKMQSPQSYAQMITVDKFNLVSDAPKNISANSVGPDPHELIYAALGACTSMTMQMYAQRKGMDIQGIEVDVQPVTDASKHNELTLIKRLVKVNGQVNPEAMEMLARVADKCPIHKLLVKAVPIETSFENLN